MLKFIYLCIAYEVGGKVVFMKVIYNVKDKTSGRNSFTFGKSYKVLADYRNRTSLQLHRDNGIVVIDDNGETNMIFPEQVIIVNDCNPCYTFCHA